MQTVSDKVLNNNDNIIKMATFDCSLYEYMHKCFINIS